MEKQNKETTEMQKIFFNNEKHLKVTKSETNDRIYTVNKSV